MKTEQLPQQLVRVDDAVLLPAAREILRLFFGRVRSIAPGLLAVGTGAEPELISAGAVVGPPMAVSGPLHRGQRAVLWRFYLHDGRPRAQVADLPASVEAVGRGGAEPSPVGANTGAGAVSNLPGAADVFLSGAAAALPADVLLRRLAKIVFYRFCCRQTGRSYPWGSLTGIRPTYVAAELLAAVKGDGDRARAILQSTYDVAPAKASLAIRVARAEKALLQRLPNRACCLYIGIPFCPSKCHYCSFTLNEGIACSTAAKTLYIEALIKELELVLPRLKQPVAAVYIGGGTPGDLNADQISLLLAALHRLLPALKRESVEICFEAGRADAVTEDKLQTLLAAGVNRLCINPQTMHDRTLQLIGRKHSVAAVIQAFKLARSVGFSSINMDLIAGLPGETPADFAATLSQLAALEPDSLTVHTLAVKRSSDLNHRLKSGESGAFFDFKKPDPAVAEMLEAAVAYADKQGLLPYYLYRQKDGIGGLENIGFARLGAANLYNVAMMSDRCSILAFGCGGISKLVDRKGKATRSPNVKSLAAYLDRYEEMARRKIDLFKM